MLKKFICVLLIVLLAVCSVSSVSAESDYYYYNSTLGASFTTYDVMMAIGDPIWITRFTLNIALSDCDLFEATGRPDEDHSDSYWYNSVKTGAKWQEVRAWGWDNDYILFTVNWR